MAEEHQCLIAETHYDGCFTAEDVEKEEVICFKLGQIRHIPYNFVQKWFNYCPICGKENNLTKYLEKQ